MVGRNVVACHRHGNETEWNEGFVMNVVIGIGRGSLVVAGLDHGMGLLVVDRIVQVTVTVTKLYSFSRKKGSDEEICHCNTAGP